MAQSRGARAARLSGRPFSATVVAAALLSAVSVSAVSSASQAAARARPVPRFTALPALTVGVSDPGQLGRPLVFSPDGRILAAAGYDSTGDELVFLFDTRSWRQLRVVTVTVSIQSMAFSPDGRLLVVAAGPRLYGYDVRRDRMEWIRKADGSDMSIGFVGRQAFALLFERQVGLKTILEFRSAASGNKISGPKVTGLLQPVLTTSAAGHRFAYVTKDNDRKIVYQTSVRDAKGSLVAQLPKSGEHASHIGGTPLLSDDGRLLASELEFTDHSSALRIYDLRTGRILATIRDGYEREGLAWSRSGLLAFEMNENTSELRVWDATTRRLLPRTAVPLTLSDDEMAYAASWSPNGQLLAASSGNARILLWSVSR
jgi:WD40 repeat protein